MIIKLNFNDGICMGEWIRKLHLYGLESTEKKIHRKIWPNKNNLLQLTKLVDENQQQQQKSNREFGKDDE